MKLFAVTLAILLAAAHAMAADYKVGSIEINAAWTRATPKGAEVAGAYMTITNTGTTTDRLLAGSSPVAGHFELHMMTMDDGVMKMRPLTGGLEIKPGATVELKPVAAHVMLVGLKKPLSQGERVKATLEFERAGTVEIEYKVEGMGATGASSPTPPMNHMDHGSPAHP
jgi:periplasmic copper chaperone A